MNSKETAKLLEFAQYLKEERNSRERDSQFVKILVELMSIDE